MQTETPTQRLELPHRTRTKLHQFRRRVWLVKLAEGLLAACCGLVVSYLLVFLLDRLWDTPIWLRLTILFGGMLGLGIWFPLKCHRWIWRTRRAEQVARLLRGRFPNFADQLLGIIELAENEAEQQRSQALCRAAMRQVDAATENYDFSSAVPSPRHRQWAWAAGVPLALAMTAIILVPAAGTNALARWLTPWKPVERYTFTQLEPLPDRLVVPYAEPFSVDVPLAGVTAWRPNQASARYGDQAPVRAPLDNGGYAFLLPPQQEAQRLAIAVGDARRSLEVEPTTRPELTSLTAQLTLPEYLQYTSHLTQDARGGSLSLLKGTEVSLFARATRDLAEAGMNGVPQRIEGPELVTTQFTVDGSSSLEFTWRCALGLAAQEPFRLSIHALEDNPPILSARQMSSEHVLLESDVLSFEVVATDDFGVKMIGMQWEGIEDPLRNPNPARGKKVVAAGEPEKRELEATATFSAAMEDVSPQTLQLRLFALDYRPDREPVYSPTYVLHVLSAEEHAIWLTNQLRQWMVGAQEVYEEELRLHETNRELRELSPEEIDQPENRRRIESQAAAETANAGRLSALTGTGEQLIQQAARNDQFNVETMESLAAMLQALQDIASVRMPSVAELLQAAATAVGPASSLSEPDGPHDQTNGEQAGSEMDLTERHATDSDPSDQLQESGESGPQVGVDRAGGSGSDSPESDEVNGDEQQVPSIVDIESGFNELDEAASSEEDESTPGSPGLTLPTTDIVGGGEQQEEAGEAASPGQELVEQAVREQEDLLEEFARVAEELQKILSNLEGSTFVKRLKAASRRQLEVAADVSRRMLGAFGVPDQEAGEELLEVAEKIAEREMAESENLYVIQLDLEAYFHRVQQSKFATVLDEMRSTEVVNRVHDIGEALTQNLSGGTLAEVEYWADTLDRWAEQLVGPG